MELVRAVDLTAWRADADAFLRAQEVLHVLMLGVAGGAQTARFAATVREGRQVIGAALAVGDRLLLSDGPPEAFEVLASAALGGAARVMGPPESVHALLTAGGAAAPLAREACTPFTSRRAGRTRPARAARRPWMTCLC
ncbi:hypothetical protein [Deinococcus maricopensis]|uniref:hypothetical protein n=1 Tax=Deinococcus maricopensis TaxID=309887 RepID=UPI0002D84E8E|nr:hypothetical protein [Deinococcus maricopensis]